MENLVDRLIAAIEEKENPCCVGLDPIFEKIPAEMKEELPSEKKLALFFLNLINLLLMPLKI